MARETYTINQQASSAKDGSFGSCLCAMLVFIGICGLLLLIAYSLRAKQPENQYQNDQHGQEHLHGSSHTTRSPKIHTTRKYERTTKESTKEETTLHTEIRTFKNDNKFEKIYESTVATAYPERTTAKAPPETTTAKAPPERITTRLPLERTMATVLPEKPTTRRYEHTHIIESGTTVPNLNETTKTFFKYTTLKSVSTTPTFDNVSDRIIFEEDNTDNNNTTDSSVVNSTQFIEIDVRSKDEDNTIESTTYRAAATTLESVTDVNIESPSTVLSLATNESTTVKSSTTTGNAFSTTKYFKKKLMEETSTLFISTTDTPETTLVELRNDSNETNSLTDSPSLTTKIVESTSLDSIVYLKNETTTQNVLKQLKIVNDTALSNEERTSERTANTYEYTSTEETVSTTESIPSTQRVRMIVQTQLVNTSDSRGYVNSTHQPQTNDTQQLDENADYEFMEFAGTREDLLYLNTAKSTPIPQKENTSRQYTKESFDNSNQTTLEFVNGTQTKDDQNKTSETIQIANSTAHRTVGNQTEEIYNEHLNYSTFISTTKHATNQDHSAEWSRWYTQTTPMPKRETLNNMTFLPNNCDDPSCRDIASQILYKMNRDEDPCEDFYQYACGGQTARMDARKDALRRIEREMFKQGTGQKSLKAFRVMYDSCLDYHSRFDYTERVEHGREIVHSLGKLAQSQFSPRVQNITELLKGLLRRGSSSLLDISMDADRHEKKFIFKISIGKNKPFLRNDDELLTTRRQMHCMNMLRPELTSDKGEDMDEIYLKYLNCCLDDGDYLRDVENALAAMRLTNETDVIVASVKKFLNILKKVYTRPNDTRHDHVAKNYSVKKVLEMMFISRKVDWTDLLQDLSGNTIDSEQILHIYDEDQMRTLFKGLKSIPNWELHNALVAMYAEDVYTNLVISYRPTDSEEFCLQQTVDLLKDVSSHYYLSSWSSKHIKAAQSILQMAFAELKKKLNESLNENTWIQPISREMFTKKLKKMQYMRNSGMDAWLNLDLLQQRLANVTLDVANYQGNVVQLVQRNRIIAYGMLGKYATETQYLWWYYVRPYDTKPVAIYALNAVVAPLGLVVNLPEKIPNYVQLARVSFAIAKEMGHHFDPTGIEYEIKMDNTSKVSYAYLESCPFDKAEYPSEDNINGLLHRFATYPKLSLNEKIAQDTAMKLVSGVLNNMKFDTGLTWVNDLHDQKQTFYVSLVQEYCEHIGADEYMRRLYESEKVPNSLMVRSFLENSEDFSQAFYCKEGSKMIHVNRCEQFPYLLDDSSY